MLSSLGGKLDAETARQRARELRPASMEDEELLCFSGVRGCCGVDHLVMSAPKRSQCISCAYQDNGCDGLSLEVYAEAMLAAGHTILDGEAPALAPESALRAVRSYAMQCPPFMDATVTTTITAVNPTTTVASQSYLESLVELAEKHQFIVCADECYNDLYSTDKPASVLSIDSKHWVCFRSLSKRSHMTGYRSGAILSKNEQLIQHLKKLRSPMGVGTPTFIQSAAQWAWSDAAHVEQHRLLYNNKRRRVKQALVAAELSVYGGDAGFYMWVKSANHDTSESLSDWFLDRGILVTPGTVFGSDGNPYVRLVFCLSDTTIAAMCDAIQRPFFQSKGQKN